MSHPTESISAYLDGELSAGERVELMAHVSSCGRCAADLEGFQRVRAAVRSLPVVEVPDGLLGELSRDADVVPLHRNKGIWMGAAAALIAAVIAVAALFTPQPSSVSVDDLSSRFGARASLDPAFGPAKVVVPPVAEVDE